MRVFLVRHGPAEEQDPRKWPDDSDRPLSREGKVDTRRAAEAFAKWVDTPNHFVTSPAVRAYTTAELFHAACEDPPALRTWPELAPGSPAAPILERLRNLPKAKEAVVMFGHEPTLSELVGFSIMGEAISLVHFARAGVAAIDFPQAVTAGGGRLDWLLTRKQLTRLGQRA